MANERTITITRRVTEAAQTAARENGAKAKAVVQSEEHRAKLRDAQQARRERERQQVASGAAPAEVVEKRAPGRPRKEGAGVIVAGEKRGRGRPKKQEGPTSAQTVMAS